MSQEEFWIKLWRNLLICITIIVLGFSGCTIHQHRQITKAIESGVSPERVRIAYSSQTSDAEKITALLILSNKYNEKGE